MPELYIGIMSGTSLDGADGVLVDFSVAPPRILGSASLSFSNDLRARLLALNSSASDELHRAWTAGNELARLYAQLVVRLRESTPNSRIVAVGMHGQTVRHQPQSLGSPNDGYTIQLGNAALLAELTGMDVVSDFRSRDVAAGGQGAPLVPAFHQQWFSRADESVAVLNLGGIANLSILPPTLDKASEVIGFDCGPGNCLMDAWAQQQLGKAYDDSGQWAATGRVIAPLLERLLSDPFFDQAPPKSTGRDLFSLAWLADKLAPFASERPQDIQSSLAEMTASACAACLSSYAKDSKTLVVCGGGAFNLHVMSRLQALLPGVEVAPSSKHGLPALEVEATAFAWLARQTILRLPGNLSSVTGAAGLRVLGAIYPA